MKGFLKDIEENTDDVCDAELNRISKQFGDYDKVERW